MSSGRLAISGTGKRLIGGWLTGHLFSMGFSGRRFPEAACQIEIIRVGFGKQRV
jgi:hypothetical protein